MASSRIPTNAFLPARQGREKLEQPLISFTRHGLPKLRVVGPIPITRSNSLFYHVATYHVATAKPGRGRPRYPFLQ
jgi:hypothetical protein